MWKKIALTTVLTMAFGTTDIMANTAQMAKLASQQEILSHKVVLSYRKHDNAKLLAALHTLESGHMKLRSGTHNAEINNLLVFLDLCLNDLKKTVQKPYSAQNAQHVADLSDSLSEGNRYIEQSF